MLTLSDDYDRSDGRDGMDGARHANTYRLLQSPTAQALHLSLTPTDPLLLYCLPKRSSQTSCATALCLTNADPLATQACRQVIISDGQNEITDQKLYILKIKIQIKF